MKLAAPHKPHTLHSTSHAPLVSELIMKRVRRVRKRSVSMFRPNFMSPVTMAIGTIATMSFRT